MTQQEVIQRFMASLDKTNKKGEYALDEAVRACSTFNSFQELKTAILNDCRNADSGDDFLKTYCGINLDNEDTGAITGSDAGGSTVKTKNSIVPENGLLDDYPDNEFTVNGFKFKLTDDKFNQINLENLTDDTLTAIILAPTTKRRPSKKSPSGSTMMTTVV